MELVGNVDSSKGTSVLHLLSKWIEIIYRNKTSEGKLNYRIIFYARSP